MFSDGHWAACGHKKGLNEHTYDIWLSRAMQIFVKSNLKSRVFKGDALLANFGMSQFWLFKCVDRISIYGSCFVLFLVVECNNQIKNISNSMTLMIFSSIKSWVGKGSNRYNTKSLKIHKSLTNCLIIKNYTIFGKHFFLNFSNMLPKNSQLLNIGLKYGVKRENSRKWPLNDLLVTSVTF